MPTFGSNCQYIYERNGPNIGKGANGTVYAAVVQVRGDFACDEDIVAVKEIFLAGNRNGTYVDCAHDKIDQIRTEKNALGGRMDEEPDQAGSDKWESLLKLNHKNIVRYHKITLTDAPNGTTVELMMDYFPAGDLASFISKRGPAISIGQLFNFAQQMAEGLAYLHSAEVRVIHGDLKPANVMLRIIGEDQFVLQIADLDDRIVMIHNKTCTKDVTHAHGTVRYMSPELVKMSVGKSAAKPGRKTDVWSLGCTVLDLADFHVGIQSKWLHHKRTRDTIRIDGKLDTVAFVHIANGYVPLVNELAPKKVADIVDECLNEDAEKRISAADLVEKIKEVQGELITENSLDANRLPFQVLELIDRDSSGMILKARRMDTNAVVAVRRVTLDNDANMRAAQLNVLRSRFAVVTELDHPSIVRYFHSQVQQTYRYEIPTYDIFMEFCSGNNMSDLGRATITALHVQRWARQLVDGIAHIHDRGVVHRNISAYNVLMTTMDTETCHVKIGGLCDVVRLLSRVEGEASFGKNKWDYMSPEMILDGDSDASFDGRTDIWNAGCVVVQMATGKPPEYYKELPDGTLVKVQGAMAIMYFVATGGTPRVPAELPTKMRSFAQACLRRVVNERPFAADLKGHEFLTATADEVTQWVLPRPATDKE